ncbi:unnamed protein product [Soboliphyme baturini]|uniref:Uncharacterized protein n=1 Tax=Soboliphyme baturini TaxID=241478 RepID=A0A183IXM5_9BILA|nr:unnamed protein product [Soboliphyme baturini]
MEKLRGEDDMEKDSGTSVDAVDERETLEETDGDESPKEVVIGSTATLNATVQARGVSAQGEDTPASSYKDGDSPKPAREQDSELETKPFSSAEEFFAMLKGRVARNAISSKELVDSVLERVSAAPMS